MIGVQHLNQCLLLLLKEVRQLRQEVKAVAGEGTRAPEDMTRPLTAEQLCARWRVEAASDELRLLYLGRKCRAWGLRPLQGGRGWAALYSRADVLHAESFAGGKIKRRRHAA
jgi:hypothetical protein